VRPSVAIICPDYPPRPGGVSDYTALLAKELAFYADVQLITSAGTHKPPAPVRVQHVNDWQDEAAIFSVLDALPPETSLLWQYVPHMYGHGGVAPVIPRLLARLRTARHPCQVVSAHEIAAPWSVLPNRFLYAWSHRRQWRKIVTAADAVVTSTEAWRNEWQAKMPAHKSKFSYAASPSTIPLAPVMSPVKLRQEWRRSRGWDDDTLVLGWFGTASAAKQLDWVFAAQKHAQSLGRPVALILIGNAGEIARAQNSPWVQSTGYVEALAVSQILFSIDLLLLPFIDGVSERRTSFMAGLAHGTPVATTIGPNTGPTLRAANICALTISNDPADFLEHATELLAAPEIRRAMGERGRTHYQTHYDWPVVTSHLLALLAQKGPR
jgi:glycosyltransferase involved in cell wall biosynthesis